MEFLLYDGERPRNPRGRAMPSRTSTARRASLAEQPRTVNTRWYCAYDPGRIGAGCATERGCVWGVRTTRGARSEVSRSEAPLLGTVGFRPPTARLRLRRPRRPSGARSWRSSNPGSEAPMPARLRVRRRSFNAPRGRRNLPGCLRRRRLQPADLPAAFERRPRDARSADITCARHRRHAMVSSASFAFPESAPEGARHRAR